MIDDTSARNRRDWRIEVKKGDGLVSESHTEHQDYSQVASE